MCRVNVLARAALLFAGLGAGSVAIADPLITLDGLGGILTGTTGSVLNGTTGSLLNNTTSTVNATIDPLLQGTTTGVALGTGAIGSGALTTAVGIGANAVGDTAVALGNNAKAVALNSIAIGNGALAIRNNQVAIGTGSNTYTMSGITSSSSRASQVGTTQIVTSDSAGNLATANVDVSKISGLDGRMNNVEMATAALQNDVATLKRDVRRGYEGTAIALALGAAALPDNKRFAVSGNIGTFRGEVAAGASAAFRATELVSFNGGVGAGFQRGGIGGRGGMTLAW